MNSEIKTIESKIAEIEAKYENNEDTYDCDQQVVDLEQELENLIGFVRNEEISVVKNLKKRLKQLREDLDVFDLESELDSMFPNGQDDD
jgi:arginyl-tRNA synthetase